MFEDLKAIFSQKLENNDNDESSAFKFDLKKINDY